MSNYVNNWDLGAFKAEPSISVTSGISTCGPKNRYGSALFIEKEGFDTLWERANLADIYDLAIMSTKGMSTVASRKLIDNLSKQGVTVFVLHDFDRSGFSILHSLSTSNHRHTFVKTPTIIDLGFRMEDVRLLQTEPVDYPGKDDPIKKLIASGATEEEANFLVESNSRTFKNGKWIYMGKRVELNAMTSDQLLKWLKGKLAEHNVQKVIPDDETIATAYQAACEAAHLERISRVQYNNNDKIAFSPPEKIRDRIKSMINNTALSWDAALKEIAQKDTELP